jgi:hypothetical protein
MWFIVAAALASPELIGVEVHGDVRIVDHQLVFPVAPPTVHLMTTHRGAPIEVRCRLSGDRCEVLDGPLAGKRLALPPDARLVERLSACSVTFGEVSAPCAATWPPHVGAPQFADLLIRSDLSGATAWSSPATLRVELGDGVRWSTGGSDAFADLPTTRDPLVSADTTDTWRCLAAHSGQPVPSLIASPKIGMTWIWSAKEHCDLDVRDLQASFCASLADAPPEVAAWCAEPEPSPVPLVHAVHEVQWKRRVEPKFPIELRSNGEDVACTAEITLDEEGVPTGVVVSSCPDAARASTERALMAWRAYPLKVQGVPSWVRAMVKINFKIPR